MSLLYAFVVYFDQVGHHKQIDMDTNEAILLKSATNIRHLKSGINATIVFHAKRPGDRILIQTYTFAKKLYQN